MPRLVLPPEPEWAQRLHASLDALGPEYTSRVSKARSYARNGAVRQFSVREGEVSAWVQGGFERPYSVSLLFGLLPEAVWSAAAEAFATNAGALALLLAGRLSTEVDDIFGTAGERLLPTALELPHASVCNCPDYAIPCKHTIAVYLAFIERLKIEPSLLFTVRGRTLEQLLLEVGRHWTQTDEQVEDGSSTDGAPYALADPDAPTQPLSLEHFFEPSGALPTPTTVLDAPVTDGAIVRQLGQPPFAGTDEDVVAALLPAYQAVTRQALRLHSQSGKAKRARRSRT